MAVWRAFLKFEALQTAIIACIELPYLTQQVKLKNGLQMVILICSGLLYSTGWAALPSEKISQRFFKSREII
jgi:hypothetical protein